MYDFLLHNLNRRNISEYVPISIDVSSFSIDTIVGLYLGNSSELVEQLCNKQNSYIPILIPSVSYNISFIKIQLIQRLDILSDDAFKKCLEKLNPTILDDRLIRYITDNDVYFKYTNNYYDIVDDYEGFDMVAEDILDVGTVNIDKLISDMDNNSNNNSNSNSNNKDNINDVNEIDIDVDDIFKDHKDKLLEAYPNTLIDISDLKNINNDNNKKDIDNS